MDAVIGDIDERYRQGRSWMWYWMQVLKALVTGLAQEIPAHKLLAVRTVTTGWTLVLVGMLLFRSLVAPNVQRRPIVSQKVHSDRCRSGCANEDELSFVAAAIRYLGKHTWYRRRLVSIRNWKRRQ